MSQKYLALTIGPIHKTIAKARHTRELWAASYTFSYLMKEICRALPHKEEILVPAVLGALDELFNCSDSDLKVTGAGLFPDRLIIKANNTTFEDLNNKIDLVLKNFAQKVAKKLNRENQQAEILTKFKQYFQLYTLEIETDGNIIETIMPYLDSMELQRNYALEDNKALSTFFYRVSESFLVKDAFGESKKNFSSLVEIATKHFENNIKFEDLPSFNAISDGEDLDFSPDETDKKLLVKYSEDLDKKVAELQQMFNPTNPNEQSPFLPCYKYVAVVQADGDNVGTIVKRLAAKNDTSLVEFSKKLYAFSKEAVKEIQQYGGMNIYAGGDDLLFFAPVRCGEQNIFGLLKKLDDLLKSTLADYKTQEPSLSFGVTIAHYKAPLYETMKDADYRLFGDAKVSENGKKNALAFNIEKHSGMGFNAKIKLSSDSFKILQKLLNLNKNNNSVDLRGITHDLKVKENEILATKGIAERIDNFFDNNFDEAIHKKEGKPFLKQVNLLLKATLEESKNKDGEFDLKSAIQNAHVILRTYLFLTSKELK
jgi:CRISPR-associated protein Cmr2